jgi:hypothetical protein
MGDSNSRTAIVRESRTFASLELGVNSLRFPLIFAAAIDTILAIFSLFLLDALFAFFALLSTVAHDASS